MKIVGAVVLGMLSLVALSGFFHGVALPRAAKASSTAALFPGASDGELDQLDLREVSRPAASPAAGLLARVNSPDYKRSADLSLKVVDCVKAEDELEAKLEKIRGEILDMLMEGTEGARRCTLRVLVPSPAFRSFVGELRGMGKVQAERISASKIRPGGIAGGAATEEVDPRELCLVAIRLADERIAQTVLEGKGVLAASFDHSASHLLKGFAVLVEGLGYLLPFILAASVLLVPALLLRRFRRVG